MNALHPLGQLIQSVEDSTGWTLREIARRIERADLNLSNAYLGKLKRQPIRAVSYETIHALAEGLDLPERVVGFALLESMGVRDLDQSEAGAAVAIARDPGLSERDRRILLAAVREMQDATDTQQHESAPIPPVDVAYPAQPDGPTTAGPTDTDIGPKVHHLDRTSTNGEPYPWEQPDFDLAAKRGRNRGREAREQQDRDAEDGGA